MRGASPQWLKRRGIAARPYHADLESHERIEAEQQLLSNEVKALVATVALGMGFDKPDLGFVIHFQRPGSVVAYYQQVGRAGRAVDSAFGILLSGREDDEIQEYFIHSAFPPLEVMTGVLAVLGKAGTLTLDQIGAELNYGRGAMEKALKLLEVDGAVEHDQAGYTRTANPWHPDAARYEQVTRRRYAELAEIKRYVEHPGCLMEFLARALDDPTAAPCGKCMNCAGHTQRRSGSRRACAGGGGFPAARRAGPGAAPLLAQPGAGGDLPGPARRARSVREWPAEDDYSGAAAPADRPRALLLRRCRLGPGGGARQI